ncbi:MAG: helicase C-terminal domain-containing protein, partial [Candidatus Helarchaeota archaeon]
KEKIKITPSCSIFYKIFPNFIEQSQYINEVNSKEMYESIREDPGFKVFYKRKDCLFDTIEMDLTNDQKIIEFDDIIKEIKVDLDLYRTNKDINEKLKLKGIKNHFDINWIKDENTYNNILDKIRESPSKKAFNWNLTLTIERDSFDKDKDIITIRLQNTTKFNGKKPNYEVFLFNCKLRIGLGSISLIPFHYTFKHEEFSYEEQSYLRTLNCHAIYDESKNVIISQPYALYYQLKKSPRISINGISAKFKELKNSIKPLEDLLREMKKRYKKYVNHPIYNDILHIFNAQFKKETQNFYRIITRFETGISILKSNPNAMKSFNLMNEVFEWSSDYESWRLFQIIFIVMVIPDIVDLKKNRHLVDIIHVDTGAGKSEAYFGLIVFLLFWDRLRGKTLGVSAITKFPLRMLSIQQLQRISKIITLAEQIRKKYKIKGVPFSVGYYVGVSDEFPRHTYEKIQKIKKKNSKGIKVPGVLLDVCPICGADIFLEIDDKRHSIYHKCSNNNCNEKFYLYFTNSEVYRFLPSLIVSTVDKLASVALNRRFKNLLGGKLSLCPKDHGFTPINDSCEIKVSQNKTCDANTIEFKEKVEGPTLMIQDEMHLLREGFGTINSHFESLLNTILKKFSDKEFKYIVMTATVSGAKDQIDHLYGKELFIFPGNLPRGYKKEDDFFFEYEHLNNCNIIQRILIGLKPNMRDNQYASLLTIHHIANFFKQIMDDKNLFAKEKKISLGELEKEIKNYQCILTYHNKKADVFGMNYFLHTVVTSKFKDFDVLGKPLTGDNTLAEIKEVIKTIQEFPNVNSNERKIHATFATSVVSHGVDIDNWNIMIFQGITRDTSEYIQALSRVGRKYTGLIFLWFYPNRVRDLSYYKNFNLYHNILQQKVEKTPINRWTKLGFKQTITSIFCGAILNYISNEIEKPLYTVDGVNTFFMDPSHRDMLKDFIKEAYYTDMPRIGALWIKEKIGEEVDDRLNYLVKYSGSDEKFFFPNALRKCEDKYFKTQYGMRGIQDEITLKLNDNYTGLVNKYKE